MFEHTINPIFLSIGILEIRYYGLIYAAGFLLTYLFLKKYKKAKQVFHKQEDIESLLLYLVVGVVIGARIFEVIFYNPAYYLANPTQIIAIWNGGLSFHGGLVGVVIALYYFAKKYNYSVLKLTDLLSIPAALALCFGRIANFINAELYGRITTVPWAVKFPSVDGFRHPSQLYEAAKNLFIFLFLFRIDTKEHKPGYITALFLMLYATLRFFIEFVREPEVYVWVFTMGQALSIPVFIVGVYLYQKVKS